MKKYFNSSKSKEISREISKNLNKYKEIINKVFDEFNMNEISTKFLLLDINNNKYITDIKKNEILLFISSKYKQTPDINDRLTQVTDYIASNNIETSEDIFNLKEENKQLTIRVQTLEEENKELRAENKELKLRVEKLEEENKELKLRVEKLEEIISNMKRYEELYKRKIDEQKSIANLFDEMIEAFMEHGISEEIKETKNYNIVSFLKKSEQVINIYKENKKNRS